MPHHHHRVCVCVILRDMVVVPRSFAGPFVLSVICRVVGLVVAPFMVLANHALLVQFLARLTLLGTVLTGWYRLADAVGGTTGIYLLLVTSAQFHTTYYASRMLPNTFALAVALHAYTEWIRGTNNNNNHHHIESAAMLLVAATTVFRCDVLLLLFCVGLYWLITKRLGILQAIRIGVTTGLFCLAFIVPLDSHLWRRWVWAEGEVFYYNTVLGKSSNWGTSPWHWYFTNAIPKAMLLTVLLVPLSFLRIPELLCHVLERKTTPRPPLLDGAQLPYLIPILGFVLLYSCLGHKEMRFIFPALPILNLAAAAGLSRLHRWTFPGKDKARPSKLSRLLYLEGICLLLVSAVGALTFVLVSSYNYPGGDALQSLAAHLTTIPNTNPAHVYIDVASSMSGVSLFGQRALQDTSSERAVTFAKGGFEQANTVTDYSSFTHLLTEKEPNSVEGFRVIDSVRGHPRLNFQTLDIYTREAIYVMEKRGWYKKTRVYH